MKKEKPLIQHPTDPLSTQAELPVPQPLFDDRSMNLSEKEIIDLFEKMMVSVMLFCQQFYRKIIILPVCQTAPPHGSYTCDPVKLFKSVFWM